MALVGQNHGLSDANAPYDSFAGHAKAWRPSC